MDRVRLIILILVGLVATLAPPLYGVIWEGLGQAHPAIVATIVTVIALLSADGLYEVITRLARQWRLARLAVSRLARHEGWWLVHDARGPGERGMALAQIRFEEGIYHYQGWTAAGDLKSLQSEWHCQIIGKRLDGAFTYDGAGSMLQPPDRTSRVAPTGEVFGQLRFEAGGTFSDTLYDTFSPVDRLTGKPQVWRSVGRRIESRLLRQIDRGSGRPGDDRQRLALLQMAAEPLLQAPAPLPVPVQIELHRGT